MENNQSVIPFQFEGEGIRVIDKSGDPWFVLADVCRVLEVGNSSDAARRLDEDEKGVDTVDTLGGKQSLVVVNESGLYSLIMTSRKEVARRFKKWVTAEVLPAIRKTGRYGAETDPIKVLNDPAAMRGLLLTYSEKVIALQAANAELTPKAEALDRIATAADGALCITAAAKALQVRPKELFTYLHANSWIYRRPGAAGWLGYQAKVITGMLEHKVTTVSRLDGTEKIVEQVLITAKGLTRLAALMKVPAI